MRKVVILTLLAAGIALGTGGCGHKQTGVEQSRNVDFKTVRLEELTGTPGLDPNLKSAIEKAKEKGGTLHFGQSGELFVFVALGQRNTSGYEIKVLSIETRDNGDSLDVKVREVKPDQGKMLAQVITYPYVLVNVGKVATPKDVRVSDEEGKQFNTISY